MRVVLNIKRVFLGSISILIIFFLLSKIELKELFNTVFSIRLEFLFIFLLLFIITYLIRAMRILIAFNIRDWTKCFQFIGIFQLTNRTLPFRSGEIFFPILIKRMFSFNYSSALFELIIIRFFDLFCLLLIFMITVSWYQLLESLYIAFISAICILGLWILFLKKKSLISGIFNLFIKAFPSYMESAKKYKMYAENAIKKDRLQLLMLFILSLLDKIVGFSCLIVIVYGMGFSIEFEKLLAAICLSGFTEILPINSFGNFGTLELGWVGALIYLDVNLETAIHSGFSTHLIYYFFTALIGVFCFVLTLVSTLRKQKIK